MKLRFQDLLPEKQPIRTVAEYVAARRQYDELNNKERALRLELKRQRDQGRKADPRLFEKLEALGKQESQVMLDFFHRLPYVLISRCPFCARELWGKVGIFSLVHEFWYHTYSDGREEVADESLCPHLFCVDGALNLNGHPPIDAQAPITVTNNTIHIAAEIPFVKPRVLNLPTMVAVVHSFPVADRYTAYPIVYFAEEQPPQQEFCIGWARQEYVDHYRRIGQGVVMIGRRMDAQDYELERWVRQGKLFWLDPANDEHPLADGSAAVFPYSNVAGRRHPYTIKEGRVQDLPNPAQDSKPEIRLER